MGVWQPRRDGWRAGWAGVTITLTQPASGPIGVGLLLYGTVGVGPPAIDDLLSVSVQTSAGDEIASGSTVLAGSTSWSIVLGFDAGHLVDPVVAGAQHGAAVKLAFSWIHASGALVELHIIPTGTYTHDPSTSLFYFIDRRLALAAAPSGPVTIEQLLKSTSSPLALANPFSGSGSLSASAGTTYALGLHWAVNTAPSEAGQTPRSVLIYSQTYISFTVHYKLHDATSIVGETVLSGEAEGLHIFDGPQPASIAYQILPGWTVHLDWLVKP